jgi:signal transduction histidine kinase
MVLPIAALVGLTLWGQVVSRGQDEHFWLDVSVGLVGCALLPLLSRWPVATAVFLAALAVVSPAATPPATAAALYVAHRRPLPVALGVAAFGIAAHAAQGTWRPNEGLSYGWWLALLVAAYAALVGWGVLGQARRALLDSLRERAHRAEAEQARRIAEARVLERTRIAREMHDVLAHRLTLVATYAGALEYRPDASPEQVARAAGVVRTAVHQALDDLREVIGVLRDSDAADDPAAEDTRVRPQPVLDDLPRLVEESRDAGTRVEVSNRLASPGDVPAGTGRTAYRVVQEGLTNARRHGAGQPVRLVLDGRPGARLTIDIRNPLPAEPAAAPASLGTGTGLAGLAERVELAGGGLRHEATAGEFRLHAWLPWPA